MIVGGKPAPAGGGYAIKLDPDEALKAAAILPRPIPIFAPARNCPATTASMPATAPSPGQIHGARATLSLQRHRGYLLMRKGALDPALKDFNQAADIDPTNFYACWNRGALRMAEADFASAQSDFTTALSLNPRCLVEDQDRGSPERSDNGLEGGQRASRGAGG